MSEPPKDTLPNQDTISNNQPKIENPTITSKEFNLAGRLGRRFFDISKERQQRRYTMFTNPDAFPNKDMIALIPKKDGQAITETDVNRAKLASFSLVLDGAVQINMARIRQGGQLREDTDSLREMDFLLKQGQLLEESLIEQDKQTYFDAVWSIAVNRQEIPLEKTRWTDEQLKNYSESQFKQARLRIIKSREAVERYLGR